MARCVCAKVRGVCSDGLSIEVLWDGLWLGFRRYPTRPTRQSLLHSLYVSVRG